MSAAVRPRLLVSVRNLAECEAALVGGAEIVDIKEPANGPLGMSDVSVISAISRRMGSFVSIPGLSVALGELREWSAERTCLPLPRAVKWSKLGFAGSAGVPNWRQTWVDLRERIEEASQRPLRWIAVAYADHLRAQSPALLDVLSAAVQTGCAGLLIDTYDKSSGSLLNWMTPVGLVDVVRRVREQQLPLALAGKITREDLEWLCDLEPDIIAVRSAVCQDGNRQRPVVAEEVAKLREQLQLVWVTA